MTLLSVVIKSSAGAAGAGLGGFVLISIAAIWKPLGTYSPAAINSQANSLALGHSVSWQWPVLTTILLYIALILLATSMFRRKEL
jgi:ABC-2 type transport system permease protein